MHKILAFALTFPTLLQAEDYPLQGIWTYFPSEEQRSLHQVATACLMNPLVVSQTGVYTQFITNIPYTVLPNRNVSDLYALSTSERIQGYGYDVQWSDKCFYFQGFEACTPENDESSPVFFHIRNLDDDTLIGCDASPSFSISNISNSCSRYIRCNSITQYPLEAMRQQLLDALNTSEPLATTTEQQ